MKSKYLFFIVTLFMFSLIISCNKDKPPIGEYGGYFYGTYMDNDTLKTQDRGEQLFIMNTYKESIEMSSNPANRVFTLQKGKSKSISGIIDIREVFGADPAMIFGPISIDGHWEKSGDDYAISGAFSYEYSLRLVDLPPQNFIVSGDFEIISVNLE